MYRRILVIIIRLLSNYPYYAVSQNSNATPVTFLNNSFS